MRFARRTSNDKRWYPRNPLVAWLTEWPNGPVMVVLPIIMLGMAPYLLPVVLGGVAIVALVAASGSYGWRLDDDGLHELRLGRRSRVHRWANLRDAEFTPRELRVTTSDRVLTLPLRVRGARHLGDRLREVLGKEEPTAAEPVTPEVVANWLGIEPDGELDCGTSLAGRLGLLSLCVLPVLLMLGYALGEEPGRRSDYVGTALMFWLWGWVVWTQNKAPIATAHCLRSAEGRIIPWAEVTGVSSTNGAWTATTEQGPTLLRGSNGQRVANTIQQLLLARQSGAVLPRMTKIPDHALSRAESAEVSAERGISPAAGDGR